VLLKEQLADAQRADSPGLAASSSSSSSSSSPAASPSSSSSSSAVTNSAAAAREAVLTEQLAEALRALSSAQVALAAE
jgi:hypothetical protein